MERASMTSNHLGTVAVPGHAWLTQALNSPEITDLLFNGNEHVFMDRGRGLEPLSSLIEGVGWSAEEMRLWVLEQLTAAGRSWDARYPFIDASLSSGHRIHVAFPPLSRNGIVVSLRRLPQARAASAERWSATPRSSAYFEMLKAACVRGDSILIAGATGSGKTTLATDLLSFVPENERILALEDTPELAPFHPHFLSLISRPPNADGCGEVTLRTLLRQALRMRPDRIILGECRGPEVLDLLQAMNTGHRGLLATLHANHPRDTLRRIELLCLLSGNSNLPLLAIRELIAVGVQWIAQVSRTGSTREIVEISHIEGREGETILLRPMDPLRDRNPPYYKDLAAIPFNQ
jgi:pilus assembly protein CpaF